MHKLKSTLSKSLIILVISFIIVIFIAGFTDLSSTVRALKRVSIGWLTIGGFLMICDWFLETITVKIFAISYKTKISMTYLFKSTLIGNFFSAITPFSTGGQPAQIAFMNKRGVEYGEATALYVSRFIVYQLVATGMGIFGVYAAYDILQKNITRFAWFAFAGFALNGAVLMFLLIFSINRNLAIWLVKTLIKPLAFLRLIKHQQAVVEKTIAQTELFNKYMLRSMGNPFLLLFSIFTTLCQMTARVSITYFVARSVGVNCSYFETVLFQLVLFLVISLMPTPGAMGVSESGYVLFFKFLFGPETVATLLLWRFLTYYVNIIIGGLTTAHEMRNMSKFYVK
ncbi:lysylphosphatidylglycerol synthase transmembrane domain-containing protein [Pseudothermotoga lettingae]|uniref:lysylphosphatidylglycerol synthase transmembrane domain-containing protein n=1 Tax=Pseudothermotoga lettingae TaxID=177758 RepID=UPI0003229FDA|nr:lysylphosphatidylglycerol synthase transmembrane domain-containing protein [Pseudothermotoga lettingae]